MAINNKVLQIMVKENRDQEFKAFAIGHSRKVKQVSKSAKMSPLPFGNERSNNGITKVDHEGLHPFDQR